MDPWEEVEVAKCSANWAEALSARERIAFDRRHGRSSSHGLASISVRYEEIAGSVGGPPVFHLISTWGQPAGQGAVRYRQYRVFLLDHNVPSIAAPRARRATAGQGCRRRQARKAHTPRRASGWVGRGPEPRIEPGVICYNRAISRSRRTS